MTFVVTNSPDELDFDVVVVGGSLAGAATAILIADRCPGTRILLIEKSERFSRRVGEATVEVSTYFLQRLLGLTTHLHHQHLVKNGLRFWFSNETTRELPDCAEIGGRYLSRLPAYLVDRAVLDEEALRVAAAKGVEIWRPATVKDVTLRAGGTQGITTTRQGVESVIKCRWVVDASGVAAFLARREGWWHRNEEHPTAAAWARWRKTGDFDSPGLAAKYPKWAKATYSIRGSATNHFMGTGWWAWWIPLRGGDVSIGLVFDQRIVEFPKSGSVADRLKNFLNQHPVARELLADAEPCDGDSHWRRDLSYRVDQLAGDGFAIVGDAAGFIDPFYSPGLDWLSFTTYRAADLIKTWRENGDVDTQASRMNVDFGRSYDRWFDALYRDKYEYVGECDLMQLAFRFDVALYYLGVVTQPYLRGERTFMDPYFSHPASGPFFWWMRLYNRRFASIGRRRRRLGRTGRTNAHRRLLVEGFTLSPRMLMMIVRATLGWLWLELKEGWWTWFESGKTEKRAATLS